MERLTYRDKGYAFGKEGRNIEEALGGALCRGEFEATAIVEKLAEYEDLEEQGRLIKLPCKVGTPIYLPSWRPGNITTIVEGRFDIEDYNELGNSVFLTREEAEAKLKEVKNG